jgi:hypothetical protein
VISWNLRPPRRDPYTGPYRCQPPDPPQAHEFVEALGNQFAVQLPRVRARGHRMARMTFTRQMPPIRTRYPPTPEARVTNRTVPRGAICRRNQGSAYTRHNQAHDWHPQVADQVLTCMVDSPHPKPVPRKTRHPERVETKRIRHRKFIATSLTGNPGRW